jgi:processive 1,2-diacylglycerol beta-glucosyltransferase
MQRTRSLHAMGESAIFSGMPRQILVLSAAVGAGHLRAAQAVELALKELDPAANVQNVDVLTLTNALFRRLYGSAYLDLVNKAPHVLGYFYDMMDRPRRADSSRDFLRRAVEKLNLKKLESLLLDHPWDVIVNTHFLPAEIIAGMKKEGKLKTPQMTVTTDFETHRLWVNQPCDWFTTATDEGKAYLAHWGIPADTITVTGIPIHPIFSQDKSRETCLKKQGLRGDRPVVLQLAGGFGVGPIEQLFKGLLAIETPLEIVAVCGKNEKTKAKLQKVSVPSRHRAKILGFTSEMDELLCAADLVLSKPGGLTTSEILAKGVAFAIINPIPGQESRNSDYLLENGAAIKINNLPTMSHKLGPLLANPKRLQQLKDNARQLGKPRAAYDVARIALEMAEPE